MGEATWSGSRAILHADLDCFFAAVEVLDDPSLVGKAVVVGGTGNRGVVAAASYEARIWGVHSAMPMVTARRACPHAVFISGRHSRYAQISEKFHEILSSITDRYEPIGLDEAFLDVGGAIRLFGSPVTIASKIRDAVRSELGLSVCVGVGTTKQIAKLASRRAKPSVAGRTVRPAKGVMVVWPGDELDFLSPLSVGELWGVGPKTLETLQKMRLVTIGDLRRASDSSLKAAFGSRANKLRQLAEGCDADPVVPHIARKSISHEETYSEDLFDRTRIDLEIMKLANAIAARANARGVVGRTVTLKVRYGDFRTVTRSETLGVATSSARLLRSRLLELTPSSVEVEGVRLLGASLSQLAEERPEQLSLLDFKYDERSEALEKAVFDVRRRFGERSVMMASLLEEQGGKSDTGDLPMWGPSQ